MDQKIGFCTSDDGVRICYATLGAGPPLVKAPNWMTHVEFEHQSPVWSHWWEELAKDHLLVRFDQRGSGLSDREVADLSFETWVRDLETVISALGLDRFSLLGISQGGAVAIQYITQHPGTVDKLVLYGAYARGILKSGAMSPEEFEALTTLTRHGWGRDDPAYRQVFTSRFMPEATAEQANWFNELQKVSTTPENANRIRRIAAQIDVLERLPNVDVPTLVLHCRNDRQIPYEQGRQLAALIPNARLVTLESNNHLLIESEPAWQICHSQVRRFLQGGVGSAASAATLVSPDRHSLTPREIEILQLLASGKSNREIADDLYISLNTVTNHVKNILGKIECSNRTEAASYAIRHGLT